MADLFRLNPFAALGLYATADARRVRRRIEEVDVHIRLGASTAQLDADGLRKVRQQLEDPAERFREELFWLHCEVSEPPPNPSDAEALTAQIKRLLQPTGTDDRSSRSLVIHDLAVLRHCKCLQQSSDPSQPVPRSDLQLALADWNEALSSPDLERYFEARRLALGAPHVDLQRLVSDGVLQSLAAAASDALEGHRLDDASALLGVVRTSGLSELSASNAVAAATKSIRGEITRGLTELAAARGVEGDPAHIIRSEREVLVNGVLAPLWRYNALDPTFDDDALRDRIASAARLVAVDVYNKTEDTVLASAILASSLEIARSASVASQIAADIAQLRYQHHSAVATMKFDIALWVSAAANAELAAEYAPTDEARAQASALARTAHQRAFGQGIAEAKTAIASEFTAVSTLFAEDVARAGRFETVSYPVARPPEPAPQPTAAASPGRGSQGKWVAASVLGVLLLIGFASANSTPNASPAPQSTAAPTGTYPQFMPRVTATVAGMKCVVEVGEMDNRLTQMESDISAVETQLAALKSQIDSLRTQITNTEAQYPYGIPSAIYSSYSATVDRLNALVDEYNGKLPSYKSQVAAYKMLLDRRNDLARSCR